MPHDDDKARLQKQRAERARGDLDDEIGRSTATAQEKAFMRQKLAHLWQLTEHARTPHDRS